MMELITHREAAELMCVNEAYLRRRKDGQWVNYPQLTRRQDAPGCTIWMSREQVEAWVNQVNQEFARTEILSFPTTEAQHLKERGWTKTARLAASLGL